MADTVLEVGTGVFIIALVWIAAFVFGMMLLRASGPAKLGVIPVLLLALGVTVGLVLFPRKEESPPIYQVTRIEDSLYIMRYVLLAVCLTTSLVASVLLLPFHFLDTVYAQILRA